MTFQRRDLLRLAAGTAALSAMPRVAAALDYPARPVRIIVGFSSGSASDIIARLTAQRLSQQLGQPFIVENHPGAATNLAAADVVRAPPDGYTLLLLTSANTVNATLYTKLNFNLRTDIAPVAPIDLVPYVLEVTNSLPAKTLPEFIAYAKANPGKINMASNGVGSGPHVAGELFEMMAGIKLVHVPYTGNPYSDLIAGQVQMMFSPIPASIAYVKSGQFRPLAVGTPKRLPILPDVPAVAEILPGYDASGWHSLAAPKGTPSDIVNLLNKTVSASLADPTFKAKLADLGGVPMPMTAAEFGKFITDDIAKWAKVIEFAGIKGE
ncbi:MAG TPA: tripartite tricarboxylate transporter substrate binding protein [Xanthobacteraceae bacterium]|nr:tripartite tricarboxylate transporter substrate binding protein [Xanthobacteraceae bacterium]